MSAAGEMIWPPPGKSGPGNTSISSSRPAFGFLSAICRAATTSLRLCEGISVAMPTAMPLAPLSSTNGSRAGSSFGSWNEPS